MQTNPWLDLLGVLPQGRYIKGNVVSTNADGSITVATADGATILTRPLPGQVWANGAGVFVQDDRIVDAAANLSGTTQYV